MSNKSNSRLVNYLFYFFIYSFFGWCVEVSYKSISNGQLTNRGFLLGPFCCIYGIGLVLIISFLWPVKHNPILLFAGSAALCSLLEYTTGYLMEKLFSATWWDYSENSFNIAGRVCLTYTLIWGAAALAVIYIIHPCISYAVKTMPLNLKMCVSYIFSFYFITDFIISCVLTLGGSNKISQLDQLSNLITSFLENIRNFVANLL